MEEIKTNLTADKKHVKTGEFIMYLMGVFFYTTMTGMVGGNRNAYGRRTVDHRDLHALRLSEHPKL